MKFSRVILMLEGVKLSYKYVINALGTAPETDVEELTEGIKEVDRAIDVLKAQEIIDHNS